MDDLDAAAQREGALAAAQATALARLVRAATELKQSIAARERAGSSKDPRARAADRALDDAWGAFQSWLLGWTHLPESAHARVVHARMFYSQIFPKGLQFLTLDFKDEWIESENRLALITRQRLDVLIDELGGTPFLANIRKAHAAYGEALLIVGTRESEEPDALVRKALDATHMSLREYIAHIAAMVRRDEMATIELAGRLLGPVSDRAYNDEVTLASARPVFA